MLRANGIPDRYGMELTYSNRDEMTNTLYYGDNLEILRQYVADESVDLVYLDPPFNSNATYNVLFKERTGEESPAQIKAFTDTWEWTRESERTFEQEIIGNPAASAKVKEMMGAFLNFIGRNAMMAYLVMMTPRLVELHRVLKPTGSIYLHCDPTASHYLKLLLDSVFNPRNFRNEIGWVRSLPHGNARQMFGRSRDTILFYAASREAIWNRSFKAHRPEYIEQFYRYTEPDTGRRYRLVSCINPNSNRPNLTYEWNGVIRVWKWTRERMQKAQDDGILVHSKNGIPSYKNYLDQMSGIPMQDTWEDIPPLMGSSKERLGYPTQKPLALLERIIEASSNEGDVVLDPFCGCGTAVAAAQKLNRKWIGIDITHLAVALMKNRLKTGYGLVAGKDYEVVGEPVDVGSAKALAEQDRFQFQYWAMSLLEALPRGDEKKGADRGIDGVVHFVDGQKRKLQRALVQVKSGKVSSPHIRDLKGTMEREKAAMGLFITLEEPTREMELEAVSAGFYYSDLQIRDFPKIQMRTVRALLEGENFDLPNQPPGYRRAPRMQEKGEQGRLG